MRVGAADQIYLSLSLLPLSTQLLYQCVSPKRVVCALYSFSLCARSVYSWSFESDEASAKAGGHRWVYNPDLPVRFVVIPRAAKDASELRTFTWGAGQPGHVASAWEEDQGGKM